MNYYEELGLTPAAAPEQIRKAHRTLSLLLHPDRHVDPVLRQAAELQMRRINSVIDVLLDPRQRRDYDQSLLPGFAARPPRPDLLRPLMLVVVAATTLTLTAVWMFGGDFIHWRDTPAPVAVATKTPARAPTRCSLPPTAAVPFHASVPKGFRAAPRPAVAPDPGPDPPEITALPYAPPTVALPLPALPKPPETTSFAGLWLLPARPVQTGSSGRRPVYVQITIRPGMHETIYGDYSARYEVPGSAISPEIEFTFQGPATGKFAVLDWSAPDGTRGNITLQILNPQSLQAAWRVVASNSRPGIDGGASVLIRKLQ